MFAIGVGQIAKTDPIDATLITWFSEVTKPAPSIKPAKSQRQLVWLVDRRQQLKEMLTVETNRLGTAGEPDFRKAIKKHIHWIEKEIDLIKKRIDDVLEKSAPMQTKSQRIQMGKICAITLLAHIPEIGELSRQKIAVLSGLAPYNRDSGSTSKKRHIHGGRKRIRACLYMAAVCEIRCNPVMKIFYTRLVNGNHRPKKVALTAVMRKLVIAANSAVKNPEFAVAT